MYSDYEKQPIEIKRNIEGVAAILEVMSYGVDNVKVRCDLKDSLFLLAEILYSSAENLEKIQDQYV